MLVSARESYFRRVEGINSDRVTHAVELIPELRVETDLLLVVVSEGREGGAKLLQRLSHMRHLGLLKLPSDIRVCLRGLLALLHAAHSDTSSHIRCLTEIGGDLGGNEGESTH